MWILFPQNWKKNYGKFRLLELIIDLLSYDPNYQGGVSKYTKRLIASMNEQDIPNTVIVCDQIHFNDIQKQFPQHKVWPIPYSESKRFKILFRLVYKLRGGAKVLKLVQLCVLPRKFVRSLPPGAIVYTPTTYINFHAKKLKNIVSLHDTQECAFPEFFSKREKYYRHINTLNTLEHSTAIQVSSKFIRQEIKKFYPVVSYGVRFEIIPEGVNLPDEFFVDAELRTFDILVVASTLPHKNHKTIIEALSILDKKINLKINFTGTFSRLPAELQTNLQLLRNIDWRFLGTPTDEELAEIYRNSRIVLVASLYESSSMPILEGLSHGCVAVASSIPPHLEMSEHLPISLFDPSSPFELANTLHNEIKQKMPKFDKSRIELSTREWGSIARGYKELFEKISLGHSRK